jgi:DNA polymerase III subunit epsilon
MEKVLWVDLETTGLIPGTHGIIQAAFIVEIDGEVKEERDFHMNPLGKARTPEAMAVHGLTEEDLEAFAPAALVKRDMEVFFCEYVDKFDKADKFTPAGYNVEFDFAFLESLWLETGDKYFYSLFTHFPIDVFKAHPFLEWVGGATTPEKRSQEALAKHYGLEFNNAHNALADIRMTRALAIKMREGLQSMSDHEI